MAEQHHTELPTQQEKIKFKPAIIVFTGAPGLGKSTLSRMLTEKTNRTSHDVDETRWSIFEKREDQGFGKEIPFPGSRFAMLTSYQANHEQARDDIQAGKPTILSSTYSGEPYHEMLKQLQADTGVPMKVFYLDAPDDVIEARLQKRRESGGPSNIQTLEQFLEVKNRMKKIEGVDITTIDTNKPEEETITEILSYLQELQAA